jgi:hypothetical protein
VHTAFATDLITDLILAGPDQEISRSTLRANGNNGNPEPFLKYIAARYGSFPNVWICLCNEYEIRTPTYNVKEIAQFGETIKKYLPYETPVSVHSTPRTLWADEFLNMPQWYDHVIIQKKIRKLAPAAGVIDQVWNSGKDNKPMMMPIINDELSYEGKGDKHSEHDTIESHLGAFLGGGYASTGEKPGGKIGQYFVGDFDASEHTAADNLKYLRETIDNNITFWKMAPDTRVFDNLDNDFRTMAWPGNEYLLGTNKAKKNLIIQLPNSEWKITQYDIIAKTKSELTNSAKGKFSFDSPNSRAVLFHFKKN